MLSRNFSKLLCSSGKGILSDEISSAKEVLLFNSFNSAIFLSTSAILFSRDITALSKESTLFGLVGLILFFMLVVSGIGEELVSFLSIFKVSVFMC